MLLLVEPLPFMAKQVDKFWPDQADQGEMRKVPERIARGVRIIGHQGL
jgi:hypothetical protein